MLAPIAQASPENLDGKWYEVHPYISINKKDAFLNNPLQAQNLQSADTVNKTGGEYVYTANFDVYKVEKSTEFVIDFKNTSTIAQFRHRIYNSKNQLVADTQGGIENARFNPFFLRHGRDVSLQNGHYKLITEIDSPNYLAIPEPYIEDRMHYQQSIRFSDTLTLMCLSILLDLGIYYATLASLC